MLIAKVWVHMSCAQNVRDQRAAEVLSERVGGAVVQRIWSMPTVSDARMECGGTMVETGTRHQR